MTQSFFDESRIVQRQSFEQLASIYGVSALRDITRTTANASIVGTNEGEFRLRTGGASEEAELDTAERIPYAPGTVVEPAEGFRLGQQLTGNQVVQVGVFDDNNGFFKEIDSEGLFFVVRRMGTDTRERWGQWDSGVLLRDGGSSDRSSDLIDPTDGHIWTDPYAWYGYGPWAANIQRRGGNTFGGWMDRLSLRQPRGQTSLPSPHLPIRARAATGSGDASFDLYVGGRQSSVIGDYNPPVRPTPVSRDSTAVTTTTTSTWTGVVAVRRQSGGVYALTRLAGADILPVENTEVAICLNPTIPNSGNWTGGISDIPAAETQIEENLDPGDIDISTAEWLTKIRIRGGAGGNRTGGGERNLLPVPLIENKPHVIAARSISADGDLQFTGYWRELY